MATTAAELLRVIDENPDDPGSWLAYADWLQQDDAPRGELIALDVALETAGVGQRTAMVERRNQLLHERAPALLGETFARMLAENYGSIEWRRGFVDSVVYNGAELAHHRAVGWLVDVICEQHAEPFTFVRKLDFTHTDLKDLLVLGKLAHLEELRVARSKLGELAPLEVASFLPRLRLLDVEGCGFTKPAIAKLRTARPRLRLVR